MIGASFGTLVLIWTLCLRLLLHIYLKHNELYLLTLHDISNDVL